MMRYILQGNTDRQVELGGKGRSLAALERAGLPVPRWCVLAPSAFRDSLSAAQQRQLALATQGRDMQQLLDTVAPSSAVAEEVQAAIAILCPHGEWLAVRSSALDEDGVQHSYAGQLASFLFVHADQTLERILAVWRSGFSERLLAYRREQGITGMLPGVPAVILQCMVDAEVAGVAFSADPVSGRRGIAVVSAVYGLGSALVSGEADADSYLIDREQRIVERRIVEKRTAHRSDERQPEGVAAAPVADELICRPALTDAQVLNITALTRQAEAYFGGPQDVEWVLHAGAVSLVQSRPITTLAQLADPDGALNLWDNSNIVESYSGVTTPLTYSFARTAYEAVYRQFCRLMGVADAVIADHDTTFQGMIGLLHGRIYYNLLNWYRILALLPGFTVNRRFMEQMMGVKEGLPDELLPHAGQASGYQRWQDRWRLLHTGGKLLLHQLTLPREIARFNVRLQEALAPPQPRLALQRIDELAGAYRALESKLLTRWDAPLVNDFFAMIFYGLLRRCAEHWCGDTAGTLQNDLISGQGGIISVEPARRMGEMAQLVGQDQKLIIALCCGTLDEVRGHITRRADFAAAYHDYLDRFGDRCLEELKLESATLHDDPLPLLRAVGQLAGVGHAAQPATLEEDPRRLAEARVRQALFARPFRRLLFAWVLRNARARVRDRENLRFERTRLFGRVRRLFLEMGKRLTADDRLDDARDVFYLEVHEILGAVQGTASTGDLRGLVAVRRTEFSRYREMPAPDDRFATHGMVRVGPRLPEITSTLDGDAEERMGIGCCPGVVQGRVRVITDPRHAQLEQGAILVAEHTDPGWIMLFPAARGVLVERGSLLSHSAIVARELRIPTVVAVPGVTRWLRDGDLVELDGSTGLVRRLAAPEDEGV